MTVVLMTIVLMTIVLTTVVLTFALMGQAPPWLDNAIQEKAIAGAVLLGLAAKAQVFKV